VLVLAAALAGCGGDETAAPGAAADSVPASAAAYVSFQSDLESDQWKQVEELLERFPDGGRVLPMIRSSIEEEGVDFEQDVEPALGPTVEVVWLGFRSDDYVALTQPDDEGKLRELARKGDEPVVIREIGDWSVLAEGEALLDRFQAALDGGALSDDADFQAANEELPADALASVYVDGERATAALRDALADAGRPTKQLDLFGRVVAGAAAVEAADNGFQLTAYLRSEGTGDGLRDVGTLLDDVPAGAFFAVNFRGPRIDASAIPSTPELDQFEREYGLSLEELFSLFEGEGVYYIRPGALLPELTLVLEPADAQAAKAKVDRLVAKVPATPREEAVGDVPATVVPFGRFTFVYAAFDGRLVMTTSTAGIRELREGGEKLVDEERYQDALDAAGVGDEEVVLYADLEQTVRLLEQVQGIGGDQGRLPPEVNTTNLEPLRALVASLGGEGDETTFKVFLEIE
jgi:hypothetical protein